MQVHGFEALTSSFSACPLLIVYLTTNNNRRQQIMLHSPLRAQHPDTTPHHQLPSNMALPPPRGRTLTHHRGSAAARDPFNILTDRDPTHISSTPDSEREMTSRLSIVRVIPPHNGTHNPDPAALIPLSNRPPDPGLVHSRSLTQNRSRRVSFASASFASHPGEAPCPPSAGTVALEIFVFGALLFR